MAWQPETVINPGVLAVAALCMLGTAFVSGLAPLYYAKADVGLLDQVSPRDPLVLALAPISVISIAVLSRLLPALRE
jgi:hypothetical protein